MFCVNAAWILRYSFLLKVQIILFYSRSLVCFSNKANLFLFVCLEFIVPLENFLLICNVSPNKFDLLIGVPSSIVGVISLVVATCVQFWNAFFTTIEIFILIVVATQLHCRTLGIKCECHESSEAILNIRVVFIACVINLGVITRVMLYEILPVGTNFDTIPRVDTSITLLSTRGYQKVRRLSL